MLFKPWAACGILLRLLANHRRHILHDMRHMEDLMVRFSINANWNSTAKGCAADSPETGLESVSHASDYVRLREQYPTAQTGWAAVGAKA